MLLIRQLGQQRWVAAQGRMVDGLMIWMFVI